VSVTVGSLYHAMPERQKFNKRARGTLNKTVSLACRSH